jgi:chloride channel protein, CIC family
VRAVRGARRATGVVTVTDAPPVNPLAVLRSRGYVVLLLLAALIALPVSSGAYWFLQLVNNLQRWVFDNLPHGLGFTSQPTWWPLPVLTVMGAAVALSIRYLPGAGGHIPAWGLQVGKVFPLIDLPGIAVAAIVGLGLGVVLGPEAPLIALGGGLAALAARGPASAPQAVAIVAGAGSFAAVSALFGSPILGAFLLMEAIGLGGAMMDLVLVPGLLAAGIGALVFVGFGSWTGRGTASLTAPHLPPVGSPTAAQFGWALGIGVVAAILGSVIYRVARPLAHFAQPRIVLIGPIAGLAVGGLAVWYATASGHGNGDVLFSGQNQLPTLLSQSSTYGVWALVGLVAAKSVAYTICLGSFRGGPVFPSMYIGAAIGIAMSHLPGLPAETGAAIGIGAMAASMLRLPLTSVLLASVLIGGNSLKLVPLIVVGVVVSHVVTAWLGPKPAETPAPT